MDHFGHGQPGDAEVFGKILLRHMKVRQYVLAQDGAGVLQVSVRIP
jgi:hypothetical protein